MDGILSAYQVHDNFLVWGGDAPNPFRGIPFHFIPLHSAGLPGRVKTNPDGLCCQGLFLLGADGILIRTANRLSHYLGQRDPGPEQEPQRRERKAGLRERRRLRHG